LATDEPLDYYDILQISPSAEPETIHRVYRLLAQRLHPDNGQTGDADRFRTLTEAYHVVSDPERRARYDINYTRVRKERWRLVENGNDANNDFETEKRFRLTVLEILYTRRRTEPQNPGIFPLDLEALIGLTREQQEFTVWYLLQKKFVMRTDNSMLMVTVDGIEFLE